MHIHVLSECTKDMGVISITLRVRDKFRIYMLYSERTTEIMMYNLISILNNSHMPISTIHFIEASSTYG